MVKYQPASFAAMEGLFKTEENAEIVLVGQPNMVEKKLDNKIAIPGLLSFLTYHSWGGEIKGMDAFPEDELPTNVPMLYYAYHIMVGLGTVFMGVMILAFFYLKRKKLFTKKGILWTIMFLAPLAYIANLLGWYVAELGRQPYLVYGLLRTAKGISPTVSSGNTLFTLLGFMGLYFILGVLFLILVGKTIAKGPENIN
jgi:cytochrome d ubiquinol oxidase subunit I